MPSPTGKETTPEVDLEDFSTLVEKYSDFVYNLAYRVMGNPKRLKSGAGCFFIAVPHV